MFYLVIEIVLYLLAAAVFGLAAGWLIWGWSTSRRIEAARIEERLAAQATAPSLAVPERPLAATHSSRDLERAMQREQALMEQLASAERSREVLQTKCAGFEARLDKMGNHLAEAERLRTELARCAEERAALTEEIDRLRDAAAQAKAVSSPEPGAPEPEPREPASLLAVPPETVDDLKQIKGIGARMERILNGKGVYLYRQIADFTPEDVAWVIAAIETFPARIDRDQWVVQARQLHHAKYGGEEGTN